MILMPVGYLPRSISARIYYGPMLIQARLYWKGGETVADHEARAYVFAHFPGYGERDGATG